MNNVVRLFDKKNFELISSDSDRIVTAVANFLAESSKLSGAVKTLAKNFDAIEYAIASIDDAETRSRLEQSAKRSQEMLLRALIQTTHEIGKSVGRQGA
jgi:hypothetical protein